MGGLVAARAAALARWAAKHWFCKKNGRKKTQNQAGHDPLRRDFLFVKPNHKRRDTGWAIQTTA